MRRGYELLIAEEICDNGMITDIKQAIQHMSSEGGYSCNMYRRSEKEGDQWTIVTVIFSHHVVAIYWINEKTEEVSFLGGIGFDKQ